MPIGVSTPTPDQLSAGPNLFAALEEQLGLKLEPGRDAPLLVIDSVEQPSPG